MSGGPRSPRGPRLNWALLAAFDPDRAGPFPKDLARTFQLAGESLNLVARPIERFELAGTLNHHPGHAPSFWPPFTASPSARPAGHS